MLQPSLHLLLVEDNPDHATLARNAILKSKNRKYEVNAVSTVTDAIEKLQSQPVQLVIADFHLGDNQSGLDLLAWMNEQKMTVPFIMVTGSGDEKTAVRAMQEGAYNYIVKDDTYLSLLPHIIDETFLQDLAVKERDRYEMVIREKNVQLEKANRELKRLDQLKSDFVASVSHDIRTPLNSIQESISLILDGIVNPVDDKGRRVLEIAKRNTHRLTTMINDLLDFSKLEAGKMRLHIELHDVQILVDEVLGSLKALADKKQISFVFNPIEGFPKVPCDADRILQVLTNLVGNAIKFTPEKGQIRIALEQAPGNRVRISVIDTGIGIAKEDLARVFERFEQVKGAAPKEQKGTGLGLAICKELVKLHGGDIWAESEPGKGSRFIISLPLTKSVSEANNILSNEQGR